MKFKREDATGKKLIDTLGQELFSASDYYQTFISCKRALISNENRFLSTRAYLSYSNMLRSLYEYYVGIFKLNAGDTRNIPPKEVDQLMYIAARNLINFYRPLESVLNKNYPDSVPKEFGHDFRIIRNRISHTDFRRMQISEEKEEISLCEFYRKYNFFIEKMLSHPQFAWDGEKYAGYEWKPVKEFTNTLREA